MEIAVKFSQLKLQNRQNLVEANGIWCQRTCSHFVSIQNFDLKIFHQAKEKIFFFAICGNFRWLCAVAETLENLKVFANFPNRNLENFDGANATGNFPDFGSAESGRKFGENSRTHERHTLNRQISTRENFASFPIREIF